MAEHLDFSDCPTTDACLDLIYDWVDNAFYAGRFIEVNAQLQDMPTPEQTADDLLGWLTATLPAGSKLPERMPFYHRCEQRIKELGKWEPNLLKGLDTRKVVTDG